ncbi:MAG TPA: cobalamin-binding protein [Anaerolineaceae bacterium]|jgi:5-methyltetrahydrofolate--homocysteine methyltransferase|nr:cobalamin-binding protein [Anaerolineaceae bacterium]
MEDLLSSIYQAILEGDQAAARAAVQRALEENLEAETILKQAMMPAMQEVGRLFEEGEYFVPEMLVAARAMQTGLSLLKPKLVQADVAPAGKVVAGTVKGDLHDIGKNLVCMMLEGAAFEIIDLGTDVPPERFVEAVQTSGAQLLALSALLTTTMPNMKQTIEALQQAGLRQQVKVMVGGAPVTETFARQIGADGYAPDASRAVALAKSLMGM